MAYRVATGRKIAVEKKPRTVLTLMRRHLREEGVRIADLAPVWDMGVTSVYRRFYDDRPMQPQHIEQFVNFLSLDEHDALELYHLGALEAGWRIGPLKEV